MTVAVRVYPETEEVETCRRPNSVERRQRQTRLLSHLVQAQRNGRGSLPFCLGLHPLDFAWLMQVHLQDHAHQLVDSEDPHYETAVERGRLRQELLEMRRDEWADLQVLLQQHRSGNSFFDLKMADIVAAACLGGDHLWRDLGLLSRSELGELMQEYFPVLAARNNQDMKWKKFLYKQLCEQEGGYVCRSPSCEDCAAYEDCFGPEN